MSPLPDLMESKAIHLPSGDQFGLPVLPAFISVSIIGFVPSALQTQISMLPELSDAKAILLPSGEIRWSISPDDHEIKGFDVGFIASCPVSSILQISGL
jgi:hypothetical protein